MANRLEFLAVKFKNIFSYGNSLTEIKLNSHNKTLIIGKNGSGKSSLLNIITFVLYNKPYNKITRSTIINSINKSDLYVEIEFYSNNKHYIIKRGIKPNIFEIIEDGILITQDSKSKDYQDYLESNILKISYKSFIQVCVLGSARYSSFMELPAADRRLIIEDLLGIQIFSNMNVVIKERNTSIKNDLSSVKSEINLIKEKLEFHKNSIEEKEKYSGDKIKHFQDEIQSYKLENDKLQKLNDKITLDIKELSDRISDRTKLETKYRKLLQINGKLSSNISRLKQDQDFFGNHDSCPVCKQEIDLDHKQGIILDNNDKLFALNDGMDKLKSDMESLDTIIGEYREVSFKIEELNRTISSNLVTIRNNESYVTKIENEIASIKHEDDTNIKSKIKGLLTDLKKYNQKYETLLDDKKHYDYITLMLKDGGVKTQIIKQYLPILNKYINKYLEQMNFFVNFNIDENFDEVIKSRYRDEFSFSNFSEGEKVRISLCLLFAFKQIARIKNSVSTNIQFFDEIIDGASDEEGIDAFLNLISESDSNIFVISHRTDNIFDKFDRVIKAEKVKNFSRLIELK